MKIIILLCGILSVLTTLGKAIEESIFLETFQKLHSEPPTEPATTRANPQTSWITQRVDHFHPLDMRTWQMRYISNDEFYRTGGPLFIYVGGEWTISSGRVTSGHMYDMAKEHNGYMFYTEHRYYGQSRPTTDLSNANMEYLHVRQALADLAIFISTMKSTIPCMSNSKVILVGCSYAAAVVTWFKRDYPQLANGVWASSAPLLAKVDFEEYKEIVGQSMELVGGKSCYNRVERGIAEMESMFANKRGAEIKTLLKLCSSFDVNSELDVATLFYEISDIFASLVQTHNDGNIQSACSTIMSGTSDLNGLSKYLLGAFGNNVCNDLSYAACMAPIKNTAYGSGMMRQWVYQTCNEYGWYQTSDSNAQPFGTKFPIDLYMKMCRDAYGASYTDAYINEQANMTNAYFGGLNVDVENVYFTHGQLDPWRAMGIQDKGQANVVPLYAHCKDTGSISSKDTAEMRASKQKIAQLVRVWLAS